MDAETVVLIVLMLLIAVGLTFFYHAVFVLSWMVAILLALVSIVCGFVIIYWE